MILMRIKRSRIGFEIRTFQGVNCHHVDKIVSETRSVKWISSELRVLARKNPGKLSRAIAAAQVLEGARACEVKRPRRIEPGDRG